MDWRRDWDIVMAWSVAVLGFIALLVFTHLTGVCTGWCGLGALVSWIYGSAIVGALMLAVSVFRFGFVHKRHLWFSPHIIGFLAFVLFAVAT